MCILLGYYLCLSIPEEVFEQYFAENPVDENKDHTGYPRFFITVKFLGVVSKSELIFGCTCIEKPYAKIKHFLFQTISSPW